MGIEEKAKEAEAIAVKKAQAKKDALDKSMSQKPKDDKDGFLHNLGILEDEKSATKVKEVAEDVKKDVKKDVKEEENDSWFAWLSGKNAAEKDIKIKEEKKKEEDKKAKSWWSWITGKNESKNKKEAA